VNGIIEGKHRIGDEKIHGSHFALRASIGGSIPLKYTERQANYGTLLV
jgi:hypothetical protein